MIGPLRAAALAGKSPYGYQMNPNEQALQYPLGPTLPAPAQPVPVAAGVLWVRMPLPFQLDHVHLYLLRDHHAGRDGWTLVDCGIGSQPTRELWEQIFADQLDGLPIVRVVCTHMHPDHVGLAEWISTRFGVKVWMTVAEYALARVYSATLRGADGTAAADHFRRHGITDPAQLEAVRVRGARHFASLVPSTPTSFRRIRDGEEFAIGERSWRVIVGIGHSPEHASLYSAEGSDGPLLLSGDMVLPRISTNVSVFEAEPESNPVSWYLDSLRRFEPCDQDTLVLPSHGRPFRGLHERLRQLHEHHQERLEEVRQACAQAPRSAADIVPIMFKREFDTHQLSFAMGEALAHLHALWYGGELRRDTDADGVIRFTPGVDAG